MAKLSGWTYFIIGLIVAAVSYIINLKSGEIKLFLFFIIGVAFIVIGFFKIITEKKLQKKPPIKRPKIVFCPYCGQAVYETQQYCHRCRSRLR